jgi:RNase H-like domain found in reverse transcriptase
MQIIPKSIKSILHRNGWSRLIRNGSGKRRSLMNYHLSTRTIRTSLIKKDHNPGKVCVYMDDVLIATGEDVEEHQRIVCEVLEMFCQESFFLKLAKCNFEQTSIDYLGIWVEGGVICIDPMKKKGLTQWTCVLSSVTEVQQVLGVLGYQQPFIPHFAHLAAPLTALLKKGKPFKWTEECMKALDTLIHLVEEDPVLQRPDYDRPFEIEVDASQYVTRAILY